MKFDLKDFKKTKENYNTATLKHPNGHEISIAKNKLTPKLQKQLSELPYHDEGGEVDEESMPPLSDPDNENKRQQFLQQLNKSRSNRGNMMNDELDQKMGKKIPAEMQYASRGGKVRRYDDGGDVTDPYADNSGRDLASDNYPGSIMSRSTVGNDNSGDRSTGPVTTPMGLSSENANLPVPGYDKQEVPKDKLNLEGIATYLKSKGYPGDPLAIKIEAKNPLANQSNEDQDIPQNPRNIAPPPQQAPNPNNQIYQMPQHDYLKDFNAAIGQQTGAMQDIANQQAATAKLNTPVIQSYADSSKELADMFDKHMNDWNDQTNKVIRELPTMDPNHYWNSLSGVGKASSMIGVFLGGLGAGIARTPNYALELFQNRVNADLKAQEANLGTKKTILSHYLDMLHNAPAAYAAAGSFMKLAYANGLEQNLNKAAGPLAQAQAQDAIGKLRQSAVADGIPIAQHNALMNMLSSGRPINPNILPQELQDKYVAMPDGRPAFAASKEEAVKSREAEVSIGNLRNLVGTLKQDFANGPNHIPFGEAWTKTNVDRNNIVLELNKLHGLNRLNDKEFETHLENVPGNMEVTSGRAQVKLDALQNLIDNKYNNEMKYRINNFQSAPVRPQSVNPNISPTRRR